MIEIWVRISHPQCEDIGSNPMSVIMIYKKIDYDLCTVTKHGRTSYNVKLVKLSKYSGGVSFIRFVCDDGEVIQTNIGNPKAVIKNKEKAMRLAFEKVKCPRNKVFLLE